MCVLCRLIFLFIIISRLQVDNVNIIFNTYVYFHIYMALFGDWATINKMVLYIVTQQISLWIRLYGYLCEMHGSDAITVRERIHKHTLVIACNVFNEAKLTPGPTQATARSYILKLTEIEQKP